MATPTITKYYIPDKQVVVTLEDGTVRTVSIINRVISDLSKAAKKAGLPPCRFHTTKVMRRVVTEMRPYIQVVAENMEVGLVWDTLKACPAADHVIMDL